MNCTQLEINDLWYFVWPVANWGDCHTPLLCTQTNWHKVIGRNGVIPQLLFPGLWGRGPCCLDSACGAEVHAASARRSGAEIPAASTRPLGQRSLLPRLGLWCQAKLMLHDILRHVQRHTIIVSVRACVRACVTQPISPVRDVSSFASTLTFHIDSLQSATAPQAATAANAC